MKKVSVYSVLPASLEYRYEEYIEASRQGIDFKLLIGDSGSSIGQSKLMFQKIWDVTECRVFQFKKFNYQTSTIGKYLFAKYDFFFIQAHLRFLDFWIICLCNIVLRRKLIVHGQGLYRYKNPGVLRRLAYLLVLQGCFRYLCYNEYCLTDLRTKLTFSSHKKKATYANNYIRVETSAEIQKNNVDFIFIGRLRENTGIAELLDVFSRSNEDRNFHVVGDGPKLAVLKGKHAADDRIHFHGAQSKSLEIKRIASKCAFGIYPGDAGLSLLHYAALGIIPIFHNNLSRHMGPECAYFEKYFKI